MIKKGAILGVIGYHKLPRMFGFPAGLSVLLLLVSKVLKSSAMRIMRDEIMSSSSASFSYSVVVGAQPELEG